MLNSSTRITKMGQSKISAIHGDGEKLFSFITELLQDVESLERLIKQGLIESGIQRIGAEQEFCFVDEYYQPAPIIIPILEQLNDHHFTVEHAKFNGEINLDPLELKAGCFAIFEENLVSHVEQLRAAANSRDCDIILTGILPTIGRSDLSINNLTPKRRYQALSKLLNELRGEPYEFRIEGVDQFIGKHVTTMFEACNTSFQIHLQLDANEIVDAYNWSQAIAGPVLSCATNSPLLLGKRLWRETRIALFQQSVDIRSSHNASTERIPRVSFGSHWVKDSIVEIFKEDIIRHPVLLGAQSIDDPQEIDYTPKLRALSIHNGTIYRWNRPCYGITNGKPHLRIECRYLPAGPTIKDEVANSAFWVGLMKGLPEKYKNISSLMDFADARSNFVKGARLGLGAQFKWMNGKRITAKELILEELIPIAEDGLSKAEVPFEEAKRYLDIIRERVDSEKTGSQWIRDAFSNFKKDGTIQDVLIQTTAGLIKREKSNIPVHKWEPADKPEVSDPQIRYHSVGQIMSDDLVLARPNDPVMYLEKIMQWRDIHHILIVDTRGKLQGLVSSSLLNSLRKKTAVDGLLAQDIMIYDPLSIGPETKILMARNLMRKAQIGCLPIEQNHQIVGIITKTDLERLTSPTKA